MTQSFRDLKDLVWRTVRFLQSGFDNWDRTNYRKRNWIGEPWRVEQARIEVPNLVLLPQHVVDARVFEGKVSQMTLENAMLETAANLYERSRSSLGGRN